MNPEEMERAANTFDNAVDQMQRVANQFGNLACQMQQAAESMVQSVALMDELLGEGKAEVPAAIEALKLYEQAFEAMFSQCLSNGIKDAWGKPVDCTLLNKAHCAAERALKGK